MTVTLYSANPDCQGCKLTRRQLIDRGIKFSEAAPTDAVIAAARAQGLELTAPIVQAGDQLWTGYRPDRIDALATAINAA